MVFGLVLLFCCLPDISVKSLHPAWFAFLQAHICFVLKFAHLSLFCQDILASLLFLYCLLLLFVQSIFVLFWIRLSCTYPVCLVFRQSCLVLVILLFVRSVFCFAVYFVFLADFVLVCLVLRFVESNLGVFQSFGFCVSCFVLLSSFYFFCSSLFLVSFSFCCFRNCFFVSFLFFALF